MGGLRMGKTGFDKGRVKRAAAPRCQLTIN